MSAKKKNGSPNDSKLRQLAEKKLDIDGSKTELFSKSQKTVYSLLQEIGYSMQANRKIMEGKQNPDRDAQFHFINNKVKEF